MVGDDTNQTMIAGKGNDTIAAKGGDDLLVGGLGDDTYIIGSNSGRDTVIDTQGNNTLRIVDGIGFNDVANTVNKLEFESGGQISAAQLYGAFGVAAPTNSQITSDILSDNEVVGTAADDILVSGAGNDTLSGAEGNDTYVFKSGFGQDTVVNEDAASTADIAHFSDVNYQDLWLSRNGDDLQINVAGTNDQVSVEDWYSGADSQLDEIRVNNAVLLNNQVDQLVSAMASFEVPNGVGNVIQQNVKDDLQSVLASTWQAN